MLEYFWEVFFGAVFVGVGSVIALALGGLWWIGAIIGLVVYLLCLLAFKTGIIEAMIVGLVDGFTS